ncbi:hypothetical protein [Crateriforma conspicua]|uniref:hypothetical protein n=1 Tax=Crateriforma conspicua TaxID=2527996 RepID=UPI0013FD090D|nr:hypothetical protein [Crateriforma conspicua]
MALNACVGMGIQCFRWTAATAWPTSNRRLDNGGTGRPLENPRDTAKESFDW